MHVLNKKWLTSLAGNKSIHQSMPPGYKTGWHAIYRPSRMRTPAAIARIAIIKGRAEKLNLNNSISPVRMSQMLSNRKPKFLVIFKVVLLSNVNE